MGSVISNICRPSFFFLLIEDCRLRTDYGGEIGLDGVEDALNCAPCSPDYTLNKW